MLGLQLAYVFVNLSGEADEGVGARFQLLVRFNDYFAVGPEVAVYPTAGFHTTVRVRTGGGEDEETRNAPLAQVMGVVRLGFDRGIIRPALLTGPAITATSGESDVTFVLGAELAIAPGRLPVVIDARYFKRFGGYVLGDSDHLTFGLGTRF